MYPSLAWSEYVDAKIQRVASSYLEINKVSHTLGRIEVLAIYIYVDGRTSTYMEP